MEPIIFECVMAVNDASLLQTSPLHSWIGIVAADKAANSVSISVMIPELTPSVTGTVSPSSAAQAVQLTDINGNAVNSSVQTGNTITAYYIGGDSNRKYPPDVVKGEQVKITKFANADKYYWESMGRDDAMRKTETHRIEATNRTNHDDPTDDDHSYSVELDTKRNKHICVKTSKGTGESFAYQLLLDGGNSTAQLTDDNGNSVIINSSINQIIVRNNKQAFFMLNGEDIVIGAPRDLIIKAGRQVLLDSPLVTMNITSGSGVLAIIANAIAVSAKSAATITSPAIGLNGAVQVPSILTANQIRAGTYANGAPASTYTPATINLGTAQATVSTISPDTTMPTSQRTAAAWEQVSAALTIITNCFNTIQSHTGYPTAQSGIPLLSAEAPMPNLQGT